MREKSVFAEALKLPLEKRAELAAALLESLDGEPDEDVESAWIAEIEKRVRAIQAGTAKSEDWNAVRDRARKRLAGK